VPKEVPLADYRSFTLCDKQTRSTLRIDQRFPGLTSFREGMVVNEVRSVDVYTGPNSPRASVAGRGRCTSTELAPPRTVPRRQLASRIRSTPTMKWARSANGLSTTSTFTGSYGASSPFPRRM
jgi:hypothetical protein